MKPGRQEWIMRQSHAEECPCHECSSEVEPVASIVPSDDIDKVREASKVWEGVANRYLEERDNNMADAERYAKRCSELQKQLGDATGYLLRRASCWKVTRNSDGVVAVFPRCQLPKPGDDSNPGSQGVVHPSRDIQLETLAMWQRLLLQVIDTRGVEAAVLRLADMAKPPRVRSVPRGAEPFSEAVMVAHLRRQLGLSKAEAEAWILDARKRFCEVIEKGADE